MIQAFIAFRYKGVSRTDEILKKPQQIGWKCRKYIKWREVHNSRTDAKALYTFADELIEKERLAIDLYSPISGVFLNVQKWRIDKEKMAIDPPARKEWEKREILLKAAQINLSLISARLSEQKLKIEGLSSLGVQILFYASELDGFLRDQNISTYPAQPISKTLLSVKEAEWGKILVARFEKAYQSVGLPPPKYTEASLFLQQVIDDLGFTSISLDQKLSIPIRTKVQDQDTLVEIVPLEKFKLVEVTSACGITQVRLNKHHPFIKSIITDGTLTPNMIIFFKSYSRCMLSMGGAIDTLETFNSYLGVDLHTTIQSDLTPL